MNLLYKSGFRGFIFSVFDAKRLNRRIKFSRKIRNLRYFRFSLAAIRFLTRSDGYVFFTYVFLFLISCLQVFNSIRWYVFFTCVFSLFQGYLVNGVINAIISTLEKRFELTSSQSGLIVSSNDFIAFFLVLFISFYGGERHKPRLIGLGIITLGIGSFIFSLPHFFTGLYSVSGGKQSVSFTQLYLRYSTPSETGFFPN